MANYLSPRVVINEVDNSILVNSFEGGPALVLGEAPQGPDDNIYTIINLSQFINYYGSIAGAYPGMYAAKEYLAYGNDLKYKRVTSVRSIKIADDVPIVLTSSETVSGITGPTMRIPKDTPVSPYLDENSSNIVVYLKNDALFYKVYITDYIGNDGTDNIYSIVWNSYGYTYATTSMTADIYIGHAEPAYSTTVKFPNPSSADATATLTFSIPSGNFSTTSYYVTDYTNASTKYGSTEALTLTTSAVSGGPGINSYAYRYSFKNSIGIETPVSVSATITLTSDVKVVVTFPDLPEGFTTYVLYRQTGGSGSYYKIAETTNSTYIDTVASPDPALELSQCPINLKVNGVSIWTNLNTTTNDIYYAWYDGKEIKGEYWFDYVYSTSGTNTPIFTLIKGTSPVIEVGMELYKVAPVSFAVQPPNSGSYLEGTLNTAIKGIYLTSTFIGNHAFFYFTGTSTVAIPSTATVKAFYLLGTTKHYFTAYDSGFFYYKVKASGRGTFANNYMILTSYNPNSEEYTFAVYDGTTLLEVYSNSILEDLITTINESSLRVNLTALDSPEAATGFVPYDSDYSNEYVKYYSSDLSYGYDGYFEVSVNDFIANLDPYVAASLVAFDPDLSDLTTVSDLISSTESTLNYDLLVIPGFSSSPVLAKTMYNICQNKQFVSCILDLPSGMTPILAINYRQSTLADIDSSKTSIFWNYAKVYDSVNKQYVWLPPSVFALRAIAYTEQTTTPFAAAAGLKRGILPNVVELEYNPKLADRDLLFTAQINPLASIQGIITVWGNKTSQKITSMLSDFNVRRMLNKAEKAVYLASQSMLFDPNDAAERQAIILSIQPIFDVIAQKRGIAEFSIADSTREEDVANGMARFTINLRPTATVRIIEYDVIVNSPNLK